MAERITQILCRAGLNARREFEPMNNLAFDLGEAGARHPDRPGIIFGSRARAEQWCREESDGADPALIEVFDTRPTVRQVLEKIRKAEGCYRTSDGHYTDGVWDEYLCTMNEQTDREKWPDRYRWMAVYIVTGGSEGIYLHVDVITDNDTEQGARRLLILGKSLGHTWEECAASCRAHWSNAAGIGEVECSKSNFAPFVAPTDVRNMTIASRAILRRCDHAKSAQAISFDRCRS